MEKKYQVFISSTYKDLIEERQVVVEGVLNAGHIPAGMESFKAGSSQEDTIKDWIKASDIYVLVLGPRYGSLNKEGISYTQWEYNMAKEYQKPMFAIVLSDNYINKMVQNNRILPTELETSKAEYITFKDEVMKTLVVQVDHPAEIRGGISDSIRDIERKRPEDLEGWIKGSYLNELEELRKENKELSSDLLNRQGEVIGMQKKAKPVKDEYIGEFSFDAIREVLNSVVIEEEKFNNALEKLDAEKTRYFSEELEYDDYLLSIKSVKGSSALEYLLHSKARLLAKKFVIPEYNPVDKIIYEDFVMLWEQYSLGRKVTLMGGSVIFALNDEGRKFIAMMDIFKVKNN
ncbi:DUF4062 domain-containing protein [Lactococcus lactis]|uniref:DUF4062 domain-containing protein n=1 Tax=Lactococcus lactis TaxID=1358 RepID=UPI002078C38B|nr:DUF4062 domain-containing protein [Lactococcus lactis]USI60503.1 DUF4062 domain-containing protein [Lactococcus lactis subsp. lactis]